MHLLGDEVVDAGALVDLRELPIVTKRVRVPADAGGDAVLLLEVALADEQLANEGLTAGEVEVRLNPHATDDLPAAFLDALLDLLVHLGVLVGHPLAVLRGGLGEGVVGVLVHQLQGGCEGALDDIDGLGLGPEPGGVDVRVAGEDDVGLFHLRAQRVEDALRLAEGGIEGDLIGGGERGGVDGGDGLLELRHQILARGRERGQDVGRGDGLDADVLSIGATGLAAGWLDGFDAQGGAAEALYVGGLQEFDGDLDGVAGPGGFEENDGLEIVAERDATAVEVDDLRHGAVGVGAELEPDARAGDVVAVEGPGDGDFAAEPGGFLGAGEGRLDRLPGRVVEGGGFGVGQIADVHAPLVGGE